VTSDEIRADGRLRAAARPALILAAMLGAAGAGLAAGAGPRGSLAVPVLAVVIAAANGFGKAHSP
jgi:hypothetical protein